MKARAVSTDARLYRKAARYLENAEHSIPLPLAVRLVEGIGLLDDSRLLARLKEFYMTEEALWPWTPEKNRRDLRIVALCFMAAMVEAGDA